MASSGVYVPYYPWPSTVNVANFISTKLWFNYPDTNYEIWRQQMLCLIEGQDLLGFIDGSFLPPQPQNNYVLWRRSDSLLKGWILGSLYEDVVSQVAAMTTARDVWLELENTFSRLKQRQQQEQNALATDRAIEVAQGQDLIQYVPLHKAALRGNWEAAKGFLEENPGVVINNINMTPLHEAVGTENSAHLVLKMVEMMSNEAIAQTTSDGETALHIAACVGNLGAATILVNKMPNLLYIPTFNQETIIYPIQAAGIYAQKSMVEYLISVTTEQIAYDGTAGLGLLVSLIEAEFYDIALDLVAKYPHLVKLKFAGTNGCALSAIAASKTAFRDESCIGFWEFSLSLPQVFNKTALLWKYVHISDRTNLKRQMKMNQQAQSLAQCLCKQLESMSYTEAAVISNKAIFDAAIVGNSDIVEMIIEAYPNALHSRTADKNRSIFHLAIENRSEGVFNLLHRMGCYKLRFVNVLDNNGNTILHAAGKLGPSHKLNQIPGAALQMQRELQWFKEVEKLLLPKFKDRPNSKGRTPRMLFTEEHQQLKEEGEKWMKETTASCTIAASLIATVMFAAAITVPGGNESTTGFPVFSKDIEFIIFGISSAISLFTSCTSLLIFLSILTSRYAEEDFLHALPKRLIVGLGTLFLSVIFLMVAFSVTIYLVFGQKKAWVLIPVAALACLPVSSFVLLQYPLLIDLISSIYGRGILYKQSDSPFYR